MGAKQMAAVAKIMVGGIGLLQAGLLRRALAIVRSILFQMFLNILQMHCMDAATDTTVVIK